MNSPSPSTNAHAYLSHHVYGNAAALTVYADTTEKNQPTVSFDATGQRLGGTHRWNWDDKLKIQCIPAELPAVAAVLLGLQTTCQFKYHGTHRNKGFSLTLEKSGMIAVRLFQSGPEGVMHVVPVTPGDAFFVGGVVLSQLRRSLPGVDGAALHLLLRRYSHHADG